MTSSSAVVVYRLSARERGQDCERNLMTGRTESAEAADDQANFLQTHLVALGQDAAKPTSRDTAVTVWLLSSD